MTSASDPTDPLALLGEIADIGRDEVRGGYSRHLLDPADLALRRWFRDTAERIGLHVERDANANLWATWPGSDPSAPAIATGSHLDSVPGGGALDGPYGVAGALAAVARLRERGVVPRRAIQVVVFAEEEGSRFGVACLGSRLATGASDPATLLALRDASGASVAEVLAEHGLDARRAGPDPERLDRISAFVELHVEQGRQLEPIGAPIGLATAILAHGRWRLTIDGRGDHAGSTELASRHDPVLVAAAVILAARASAGDQPPRAAARATVGRMRITPGGTNVIASRAEVWLDARAEDEADVARLVDEILRRAEDAATGEGCTLEIVRESFSPRVEFDAALTDRLDRTLGGVPRIPTGAGHDAGILASAIPTAMLFARNPTGVSHAPEESAPDADLRAGVDALTTVLEELACA